MSISTFSRRYAPPRLRIANEHAAISLDMALGLERWLGPENGGRAELWLSQQTAYDLWHRRQELAA